MAERSWGASARNMYDPMRPHFQRMGRFGTGVWDRLGQTGVGRVIQRGAAMEFGMYEGPGRTVKASQGAMIRYGQKVPNWQFMGGAFNEVGGAFRAGGAGAAFRQVGTNVGAKTALGTVGKTAFKGLPMLGTALSTYYGYQEGGVAGAITGAGESIAIGIAVEALLGTAALPVTLAAAAVGGAAYGYYRFGEAAQKHGKKLRRLEMGSEIIDRYGNIATLRQRSLRALQNTHVNGRLALGNEAAIMHVPMF